MATQITLNFETPTATEPGANAPALPTEDVLELRAAEARARDRMRQPPAEEPTREEIEAEIASRAKAVTPAPKKNPKKLGESA